MQRLSGNTLEGPKRLFPLVSGPQQPPRNELPRFVVAAPVWEIAADFIQNNVEVSGCPLVKLLHENARNEIKTNILDESHTVQARGNIVEAAVASLAT
ncbi:hypothetical protein JQ616_34650 [Bradyrhizobium tropiciagri]|uniref:hypothetical protein n=1 Tax=Bradyrhizobium tropiciagri TaxID=312253 RepID=UPI001BAA8EEB|nr:hypothetical protein [Bradyrhizobium tropiciagri]MBR0900118.1 hypothetical protein [Bradyrhizobium tropiciagri]